MRSTLLAASAAIALLCPTIASASASDAAGFSWTGAFFGLNAGYGTGSSDWDFAGGAGSNSHDTDGGLIGLQLGYNMQLSSGLVAGIQLSTEASNVGGSSSCSGTGCKSKIGSVTDLSARLGANWGSSLVYGKAGGAYKNDTYSIGALNDKSGSIGYLLGGGVEFYIDNNITTNLEYNYFKFNSDDASIGASHFSDDATLNVFKVGFNLKFN